MQEKPIPSYFIIFTPTDASEDPFTSPQDELSEGLNHNFAVESLLQRNTDPSSASRDNQEGAFSRSTRSFITEEILEALRKADRKGRDVVVGLSNACCKWGCSKSEISSLCWGLIYAIWARWLPGMLYTLINKQRHKYAHALFFIHFFVNFISCVCLFSKVCLMSLIFSIKWMFMWPVWYIKRHVCFMRSSLVFFLHYQ